MPFKIDKSSEYSYIKVVAHDRIDEADLDQFQKDLFSHQDFESKNQLVDYSKVTDYDISAQGLKAYSQSLESKLISANARKDRRIAIVAPKDLSFGMSRVFIAHVSELPSSYHVFRTIPDALVWLDAQ